MRTPHKTPSVALPLSGLVVVVFPGKTVEWVDEESAVVRERADWRGAVMQFSL